MNQRITHFVRRYAYRHSKKNILSEDIGKFRYDLNYVKSNRVKFGYDNYKVVGLFISTESTEINYEIGTFSFTPEVTYITKNYIFPEFFQIYFNTIEEIYSIPEKFEGYNRTLEIIQNEYKELTSVLELSKNIQTKASEIIKDSQEIDNKLVDKIKNFRETLINLNSRDKNKLILEGEIKEYINTDKKWTVIKVREMSKGYDIFKGIKLTREYLTKWAKE